jgi:hypothetical protein
LISTGHKNDLTRENLWQIEADESSEHLVNKFEKIWNQLAQKYK